MWNLQAVKSLSNSLKLPACWSITKQRVFQYLRTFKTILKETAIKMTCTMYCTTSLSIEIQAHSFACLFFLLLFALVRGGHVWGVAPCISWHLFVSLPAMTMSTSSAHNPCRWVQHHVLQGFGGVSLTSAFMQVSRGFMTTCSGVCACWIFQGSCTVHAPWLEGACKVQEPAFYTLNAPTLKNAYFSKLFKIAVSLCSRQIASLFEFTRKKWHVQV